MSRTKFKTVRGEAETRVWARTVNVPPEPWVGTGRGLTSAAVTGAAAEMGSSVEGYRGDIFEVSDFACARWVFMTDDMGKEVRVSRLTLI